MDTNDIENMGKKIIKKKKGRGGNANFPQNNTPTDGSNNKFMALGMEVMQLPKIDSSDATQVETRINEYFTLCCTHDIKPTVSGLAMALGVDRRTLWEWKVGNTRATTHSDCIKGAYNLLEFMWENYMLNGKINPVSGIFIGKNNFGYQDKQEYVITPSNPLGDNADPEEIKRQLQCE